MDRYFSVVPIKHDHVINDPNQVHHINHVARKKPGDNIIVCEDDGLCFYMTIISTDQTAITLTKKQALPKLNRGIHLTLAQAVIQDDHFQLVCQKATELGVAMILPIAMEKSLPNLDKPVNLNAKETRCYTDKVMALDDLDLTPYDAIIIAYEKADSQSLKSTLKSLPHRGKLCIIVGPEGGFTESELTRFLNKASFVSLGRKIFRSETAALYIIAAIRYELEMSD